MAHVVRTPSAPFPIADASVWVHQLPDAHDNLVWLLEDTDARTAAVVDGPGARAVEAFAEARGLTVTTILNTHTHPDHIGINLAYQRLGRLDEMTVLKSHFESRIQCATSFRGRSGSSSGCAPGPPCRWGSKRRLRCPPKRRNRT